MELRRHDRDGTPRPVRSRGADTWSGACTAARCPPAPSPCSKPASTTATSRASSRRSASRPRPSTSSPGGLHGDPGRRHAPPSGWPPAAPRPADDRGHPRGPIAARLAGHRRSSCTCCPAGCAAHARRRGRGDRGGAGPGARRPRLRRDQRADGRARTVHARPDRGRGEARHHRAGASIVVLADSSKIGVERTSGSPSCPTSTPSSPTRRSLPVTVAHREGRRRGDHRMTPVDSRALIVTLTPNPSNDRTVTLAGPLERGAVQRLLSVTIAGGRQGCEHLAGRRIGRAGHRRRLARAPDDPFVTELPPPASSAARTACRRRTDQPGHHRAGRHHHQAQQPGRHRQRPTPRRPRGHPPGPGRAGRGWCSPGHCRPALPTGGTPRSCGAAHHRGPGRRRHREGPSLRGAGRRAARRGARPDEAERRGAGVVHGRRRRRDRVGPGDRRHCGPRPDRPRRGCRAGRPSAAPVRSWSPRRGPGTRRLHRRPWSAPSVPATRACSATCSATSGAGRPGNDWASPWPTAAPPPACPVRPSPPGPRRIPNTCSVASSAPSGD